MSIRLTGDSGVRFNPPGFGDVRSQAADRRVGCSVIDDSAAAGHRTVRRRGAAVEPVERQRRKASGGPEDPRPLRRKPELLRID